MALHDSMIARKCFLLRSLDTRCGCDNPCSRSLELLKLRPWRRIATHSARHLGKASSVQGAKARGLQDLVEPFVGVCGLESRLKA